MQTFAVIRLVHGWFRVAIALVLAFGVALAGGAAAAGVTYAASDTPTITVNAVMATTTPDSALRYKIAITNDLEHDADLTRTDVVIHYDPNTLTPVNSQFNNTGDFVSRIESGEATVQFAKIDNGDNRYAYLVFHVNPDVAVGGPIQASVTSTWTSTNTTGTDDFDVANVTVVSTPTTPTASITPTTSASGTTFQITANAFAANEDVVTWLNMPDGTAQSIGVSGKTNEEGNVTLTYTSTGLAPAPYTIVVHGIDSGQEYVVPFVIT